MSEIRIGTRDEQRSFRPGESIAGAAGWRMDQAPQWIEIRLFWHTDGKDTSDLKVVDSVRFDDPQVAEARPFSFVAPRFPYSFSGSLISLVWSLEIVAEGCRDTARFDLVISPTGEEVVLGTHDNEGA